MSENNAENLTYRWFYLGDDNNQWHEYDKDSSELLEYKYHDYLENKNEIDFHKYRLDENGYEIDFVNQEHIWLEDNKKIRPIGRFKGDPNMDDNLQNSMGPIKYRWYYSANEENSSESLLTPYRISNNDEIEKAYVNYQLNNASNIYSGSFFSIDFDKMEQTSNAEGKKNKVYRLKKCLENIRRIDFGGEQNKPIIIGNTVSNENSISSMKTDYFLNFRNIFPFRCFNENQNFYFYYNSTENDLILHLESGWTQRNDENLCGSETTKQIIQDLTNNRGYKLLLKVSRNHEQFNFIETHPLPLDCLKKIFNKNWYHRLYEDNCFLWKQYQSKISSQIETYYKHNYLLLGERQDIQISPDLIVNFSTNSQIIPNEKNKSMMRFNIIKPFPDRIYTVNVPEEIHSAINTEFDKVKNSQSQSILYANKYGPSTITELINQIRNELEEESNDLGLQNEYKSIENNYLNNMTNNNFTSLIIKIYTEEVFIYKIINKILRDHDIQQLLKLKYYFFSLLYSLKVCTTNYIQEKILYKGMKLRNQDLQKLYDGLETDQIIKFNEFFSTTYDKNIAEKYADKGNGSYLIEIHVPEDVNVFSIENYSRFQHEKEVLLLPGSILQFISKSTHEEFTNLSLRLTRMKSTPFLFY